MHQGAFLGKRSAVRQNTGGIFLQLVIIQIAERLHAPDERMKGKMTLLDEFPAARMRRIDDRHLIRFGNPIHRTHEAQEIFFVIDILFPMRR